jgi:hypothetical protein
MKKRSQSGGLEAANHRNGVSDSKVDKFGVLRKQPFVKSSLVDTAENHLQDGRKNFFQSGVVLQGVGSPYA